MKHLRIAFCGICLLLIGWSSAALGPVQSESARDKTESGDVATSNQKIRLSEVVTSSLTTGAIHEGSSRQPSIEPASTCARPNDFYLSFPLPNRQPYTAKINSVLDHYVPSNNGNGFYYPDNKIVAFTGETAQPSGTANDYYFGNSIGHGSLYAFPSVSRQPLIINGNYSSANGHPAYMFYDSHDGYDFKTTDQAGAVDVLAAADGDLTFLDDCYNTVRIDHKVNGISVVKTEYLHMTNIPFAANQTVHVNRGQRIGTAGGAGTNGCKAGSSIHLHFSVIDCNGNKVDPYGWQGQYPDPNGARSTVLWKPRATAANGVRWHPNGALVSDVTDPNKTVWLLQGGKRRGIPSESVFYAYGFDFGNVINISHEELVCFQDDGVLNPPPPSRLINIGGPVYEITERGYKRGFPSAQIFQALGFRWDDVHAGSVNGIPDDPLLDTGSVYWIPYRDGTLLQATDGSDRAVYIVSSGRIKGFTTQSSFQSLGYRFEDVVSVSGALISSLPKGSPITDASISHCGGGIPSGGLDLYSPGLAVVSPTAGQSPLAIASESTQSSSADSPITTLSSTVTVSGNASDAGSGDNGISSVTVNGVRANGDTAFGNGTASWNLPINLAQGDNIISVVATDNSGNRNSSTQAITVNYQPSDNAGPNLSISSHFDGQNLDTATITLLGSASDSGLGDSGISSVTVNGLRASSDTASGQGMASWSQTLTLNPGTNNIIVQARDASPNQNLTSTSITLIFLSGTGSSAVPLDFNWQYKQTMPASTWGSASAVYNNQIFVFGGSSGIFNTYKYTPSTNSWDQMASLPSGGISEGGAATIGTKIYVIGNWQDTRIRIYDVTSNQWTTGASMSSQVRRGPNVAAVNGKIYVLGSDDFNLNGLGDVHMYDPATDTWTTKSPMPTARGFASVAVVNNVIYVIGGLDENTTPNIKAAVEVYDPASDSWSIKNSAPSPNYIAGCVLLNNRIYVLGGGNGSNALNTVTEYNPAADSWRTLSPFHTARSQHATGTVNGKIYLIGGPDASVEEGTATGYAPTLSVTPKSQTVYLGSFVPIYASISSAQPTDTQVTMTSSNSTIASVSNTFFSAGQTTTSNTVWGNAAGGPVTIHVNLPDSLGGISDDVTVTVINRPPNVSTTAAGNVTSTTATFGGVINPNGTATSGWFEYGTDPALANYYSSSPQLLGAGNAGVSIYENLTGLAPSTTYYFRVVASNNGGTAKGSILSFPTSSPTPTPTPTPTPAPTTVVNFALATNGGVATASSTTPNSQFPGYNFLPSVAIDGDRKSGVNFWRDDTANAYPDWLEVDFNGIKNITEMDVFTIQDNDQNPSDPTQAMTFSINGITAFDVQYWNGSAWVTAPNGSVSGNNQVWRQFTFSPITTSKVRVLVNNALNTRSRIVEFEAWGTTAGSPNVALAANGAVASASSITPNSQFPGYNFLPSVAIDGDRKSGLNFWRDDTSNAYPDWLQVDFSGSKNISEIDVFTLQDNDQNPSDPTQAMTFSINGITAFDVQYWNGSAWVTVPNGSVSGNNQVWRQFTFSPITTSKVRVLVNNALNSRSRIVELEAY